MLGIAGGMGIDRGGPVTFITDLFNGFNRVTGDSYTGGPTTVLDNTGALVTAPVNRMGIEGGRLSYNIAEGATLGPELFSGVSGWATTALASINSSAQFTTTGAGGPQNATFLTVGKRYRAVNNSTTTATDMQVRNDTNGVGVLVGTGQGTFDFTATQAALYFRNTTAGVTTLAISVKEIIPIWLPYASNGSPIASSQSVRTRRGVVQKYASTFKGYLNGPARANYFLNSATPATQNITTTAQQYTVSVRGSGSITLSGTATGVATEAFPLTVTATAGTLTCTVSGSLAHAQVEAGAFMTSPITTAGAAVLRNASVYSRPSEGRLRPNTQGIAVRVFPSAAGQTGVLWSTRVDANNYAQISATPTTLVFSKTIAGVTTSATVNYTHAANTPFIAMAHQDPVGGMKARAKQDGGAWTAYGTNASVTDMPIGATYQTGALNGASHFSGNFPYVELVQAGLPPFETAIQ